MPVTRRHSTNQVPSPSLNNPLKYFAREKIQDAKNEYYQQPINNTVKFPLITGNYKSKTNRNCKRENKNLRVIKPINEPIIKRNSNSFRIPNSFPIRPIIENSHNPPIFPKPRINKDLSFHDRSQSKKKLINFALSSIISTTELEISNKIALRSTKLSFHAVNIFNK